ncbi:MAG: hypothetical protein KBD06_05270 [Candidatus Pacebacteria bacterium]|nr:hypothetical protein [Candidatus Paceibacterota bacterium]
MTNYHREVRQRSVDEAGRFPHPWVGVITFSNESERGQQLIADFVENLWSRFQATKEVTASQAFGARDVQLFVSAISEELVTEAIDEAIDRIEGGFKKRGETLHKLN